MAHELLIDELGDASMMYVGELPWHELGQRLDHPPTAAEGIRAARLDWEVAKTPVFYHLDLGQEGIVPGHYALVPGKGWPTRRERPVFGVVSEQYEVLQNRDAFAFFDPVVQKGLATYETAGALGKGERVWVLAKMQDDIVLPGDDQLSKYLLLANSHDGQGAVQIRFTPIRVVCNNTLTMALEAGAHARIEHTQGMKRGLENAQALVEKITEHYTKLADSFLAMLETRLPDDRAEEYLSAVFPEPSQPAAESTPEVRSRYDATLERVKRDRSFTRRLYLCGRNNTRPHMRRTMWAAYNSVTEYVDHYVDRRRLRERSPGYRLNSIWFGAASRTKTRAYETALSMMGQAD